LLLKQAILFGVLIDRPRESCAKARLVRAAIRVMDGVGVSQDLSVITVVILQHHLQGDICFARQAVLGVFMRPFAAEGNDLWMQWLLSFGELFHELLDAIFVKIGLAL